VDVFFAVENDDGDDGDDDFVVKENDR